LIVEDEAIIIFLLEDLLGDSGFEIAGVATTLDAALSLIENCGCDAAILDANLAGECSTPAAMALSACGIPFLAVSGYAASQLHAAHSGGVYVSKSFKSETLIETLRSILPVLTVSPS
jgi:DNA-binding response OmpR family regulator